MKSTLLIFALLLTEVSLMAQKKSIPEEVMITINEMYPDHQEIKWKSRKDYYQAKFRMNDQTISVKLLTTGEWIETATEMKKGDVPEIVKKSLEKKFPSGNYGSITRVEKKNEPEVFMLFVESKDSYYDVMIDARGKILKSVKRENPTIPQPDRSDGSDKEE